MKRILFVLLILFFNILTAQEVVYEILNTSINSKFAELGVTYSSNNSVIFASSKKDDGGRRTNNRQLSLELYHGLMAENGDIIQTNKFSKEINNKFFESDISFTPDFKTIYFTWNNFYSVLKSKDSAKWKTLYIFKASIDENFELSNVSPMPFNSKEYSVRSPQVSKDGKKLYFISNMPGGFGETDIYVVDIYNGGNYSAPKNLGPNVNTKKAELFPYTDQNNTLYFSSNGHKGKGGLDIFKSEFVGGVFHPAKNIEIPINSKFDDFAFVIDLDSNSGYFTSNRDGGKGDVDIYAFKVKEPICAQNLTIFIVNGLTEQPLDQVVISLFQNNSLVEKQTVGKNADFKFNLKCNETYKLVAEKENYESSEITIKTDGKINFETKKTLKLNPVECVQLLSGTILDHKTNIFIDQVVISLFQNNSLVEKQTVGKNSSFKFNLKCNETYKIVVEKENYENSEITIKTDGKINLETKKILRLNPLECLQWLSGTVLDLETNQPLPNAIVTIYSGNESLGKISLDANATFNYKLACGTQYKIIASLKNYHDKPTSLKTPEKPDKELNITLELESSVEFVTLNKEKSIKTESINFDLDQWEIRLDAAIELNKVIAILRKYPNLKIDIKSYTDSRAAADYNMQLSNKRAQTVIDYIIANGVASSRVSGRGYGETQLVNKCSKGVKCSEAEHQMNRRTEFIIIGE
ncbi:MAG: OmpA family protein [Lutibacter sp.]